MTAQKLRQAAARTGDTALADLFTEAADTWDSLAGPSVLGNVANDPLLSAVLRVAEGAIGKRCTHPRSTTTQNGECVCFDCGWMP